MKRSKRTAGIVVAGVLALCGVGVGAYAATSDDSGTAATSSTGAAPDGQLGTPPTDAQGAATPGGPGQGDVVAGAEAERVDAAVLAEYPGATVDRVVVDSDGVYQAMAMTSDGEPVLVTVNADLEVTGSEAPQGPPGGGQGEADGQTGPPPSSAGGEAATP